MHLKKNGRQLGSGSKGFTFIELMISLTVMAVGFYAFLGVALTSVQEYEFFNTLTLLGQKNQEVVNTIRKDTLSTKFFFGRDTGGATYCTDYYNALQLPAANPPLGATRFAEIDETGIFEQDAAAAGKTGNAMFFVKTLTPFIADNVQVSDTDYLDFRISAYQFVLYYITRHAGDAIGTSPDSLDLIRWSSFTVLDYRQVIEVDEEREDAGSGNKYYPRADIVGQFVSDFSNYTEHYIWDTTETVDNSFYLCDEFGAINNAPEAGMLILQDPTSGLASMVAGGIKKGEVYGSIRRGKRMSVAMNNDCQGFETGVVVPLLAVRNSLGDGFPHGFEVQIIGPSAARELFVRVAYSKEGSMGIVSNDFKAVLTTRDL